MFSLLGEILSIGIEEAKTALFGSPEWDAEVAAKMEEMDELSAHPGRAEAAFLDTWQTLVNDARADYEASVAAARSEGGGADPDGDERPRARP